jgi:hypothetical protein
VPPRSLPSRRLAAGLLAVTVATVLGACTTTGEVGGRDDAICVGQGLQPGSADYVNCRTVLANQHRDDALVARSEYFGND